MSTDSTEPTEEEIRAALEEQMKRLRVEDVVVQTVVTLVNLGARRTGLSGGEETERDLDQAGIAIEGVRRLLPLVEEALGPDGGAIRDALSQLQLAYVRAGGTPPVAPAEEGKPAAEGENPSAVDSGRLWVPGQ